MERDYETIWALGKAFTHIFFGYYKYRIVRNYVEIKRNSLSSVVAFVTII